MNDVLSLNGREGPALRVEEKLDRADRIFALANGTRDEWTVLFIHSDGGRKEGRVRDELIQPAFKLIEREPSLSGRKGCAVVPVYEMEAWALSDPVALRKVSGLADDSPLDGVPERAAEVESLGGKENDVKKTLEGVLKSLRRPGSRRRRAESDPRPLSELGKVVSLERLRQVPSFQRLEDDLVDALRQLRILDA